MKKIVTLSSILLLSCFCLWGQNRSGLEYKDPFHPTRKNFIVYDAGVINKNIPQNRILKHGYSFINKNSFPILIFSSHVNLELQKSMKVEYPSDIIPPGGHGTINVSFNLDGDEEYGDVSGRFDKLITIFVDKVTDDGKYLTYEIDNLRMSGWASVSYPIFSVKTDNTDGYMTNEIINKRWKIDNTRFFMMKDLRDNEYIIGLNMKNSGFDDFCSGWNETGAKGSCKIVLSNKEELVLEALGYKETRDNGIMKPPYYTMKIAVEDKKTLDLLKAHQIERIFFNDKDVFIRAFCTAQIITDIYNAINK